MSENIFYLFVLAWTAIGFLIVPMLLKRTSSYGRHYNDDSGPAIGNKSGWLIMELVSPVVFSCTFLAGEQAKTYVTWVFFWLWILHYCYRSLIYPFQLKTTDMKIPLMVVL